MLKIINENPPFLEAIIKAGMQPHAGVIYTFADKLYNPSDSEIPDHLMVHEEVHAEQQEHDVLKAELWWDRYLQDPYFRIQQETEAYAKQYAFVCNKVNDRNKRFSFLNSLAGVLSGPIYGNMIPQQQAIAMIKKESGVKR